MDAAQHAVRELAEHYHALQLIDNTPRCTWTYHSPSGCWHAQCGTHLYSDSLLLPSDYRYCHHCGSAIETLQMAVTRLKVQVRQLQALKRVMSDLSRARQA